MGDNDSDKSYIAFEGKELALLYTGTANNSIHQKNNTAGVKGYYWTSIDTDNKKLTLDTCLYYRKQTGTNSKGEPIYSSEIDYSIKPDGIKFGSHTDNLVIPWKAGYVLSIHNDMKHLNCSKIEKVEGNVITVDSLPFGSEIFELDVTDNAVFIQADPTNGEVDFGMGSAAFGEENKAVNYMAFAGGWKNSSLGQFSTTFGRDNTTGYCGLTFGRGNENHGDHSIVGGAYNKNFSKGYASAVFGDGNENYSDKSFIAGRLNKNLNSSGLGNALFGESNENDGTHALLSGKENKNLSNTALGNILIGRTNRISTDWGNSGAFGENNEVCANGAYAFGAHNRINPGAHNSFVAGLYNHVCINGQALFGKYSNPTQTTLFAIGNGTGDNDRKNAFAVGNDNGYYVMVGETKITEAQIISLLQLI
jgi:hypothetical protein